jgi:serine/threonine-protein kinase
MFDNHQVTSHQDRPSATFPIASAGRASDGSAERLGAERLGAERLGAERLGADPRPRRRAAERSPRPSPPSRRFLPVVATGVVGFLLLAGFLLFQKSGGSGGAGGGKVAVPMVRGLAKAAAEQALLNAGLKVEYAADKPSETVPENNVVEQIPDQGTEVSAGSTVTLTLSSGPPLVHVPNVAGRTETQARTVLATAGLTGAETAEKQPSDTVPAGRVIGTAPPAGEQLKPGTQVILIVSSGSATVMVPTGLEGQVFTVAQRQLTALGLVAERRDVDDSSVGAGRVVEVDHAGQRVPRGTKVAVYVSKGPVQSGGSRYVIVPNVVGLELDEAETRLRNAGLNPEPQGLFVFGGVKRQSPRPGERVRRGTTVQLFR